MDIEKMIRTINEYLSVIIFIDNNINTNMYTNEELIHIYIYELNSIRRIKKELFNINPNIIIKNTNNIDNLIINEIRKSDFHFIYNK